MCIGTFCVTHIQFSYTLFMMKDLIKTSLTPIYQTKDGSLEKHTQLFLTLFSYSKAEFILRLTCLVIVTIPPPSVQLTGFPCVSPVHSATLFLNVLACLAYFTADSQYGVDFGLSILWFILFTPVSFICWYRPVYKAFRYSILLPCADDEVFFDLHYLQGWM